jgi:hypothetical protein
MRRLQQLALVGILAFGGMTQAQNRNGGFRDDGYRDDDRFDRDRRGDRYDVIDRTQADLNRLSRIRLDSRDFSRVNDLNRNLQQFEARMSRGQFDKDRLDHIIETLQHLADSHRLPQNARSMLYADVQDLRQFRANRGSLGGNRNRSYR